MSYVNFTGMLKIIASCYNSKKLKLYIMTFFCRKTSLLIAHTPTHILRIGVMIISILTAGFYETSCFIVKSAENITSSGKCDRFHAYVYSHGIKHVTSHPTDDI